METDRTPPPVYSEKHTFPVVTCTVCHSYIQSVVPLLRDPPHQRPPHISRLLYVGMDAVSINMHPPPRERPPHEHDQRPGELTTVTSRDLVCAYADASIDTIAGCIYSDGSIGGYLIKNDSVVVDWQA